jgi:hypothetical protein
MTERSWFFAANGQQQGPVAETRFRDLIAQGSITPDSLVWTEGMANWQRAGDIPGLMSGVRPPAVPRAEPPSIMDAGYGGGALTIDFGIWQFFWRSLVATLGGLLVIPGPWLIVWFLKWIVSRVRVPGRPNLSFIGNAMTLVPWYFGFIILAVVVVYMAINDDVQWPNRLLEFVQFFLYWLFLRWLIGNLASNGQSLGLSFSGSFWAYLGWSILLGISILTIIGWAWVIAAQLRWICRNIQGTRRQVVYKGTGLQNLWRTLVMVICCIFIIPIPWMYRWMLRWQLSQTQLIERV